MIIPEKGDSCILHFLDGQQLSHPFILGSIFHGGNAENQGGGKGNHIKRFTDKAGSYWSFNTKEGSITIQDKKGSESQILMDGQQNIHVKAGNSVNVNVGDDACVLNMKSDGTVSIQAKKEIKFAVGGSTITMDGESITQVSSRNSTLGKKNHIQGESTLDGGKVFIN